MTTPIAKAASLVRGAGEVRCSVPSGWLTGNFDGCYACGFPAMHLHTCDGKNCTTTVAHGHCTECGSVVQI